MAKLKAFKCEVVKKREFPDLQFNASLGKRGYWEQQVNLLRGDPDAMLKVRGDDPSSIMQLRKQAKDKGLSLLFAREGEFVFVCAYIPSEAQTRLVLLLREPRTVNEIRAKGLETDVESELQRMAQRGHATFKNGKWQLTEKGTLELVQRAAVA
jgi:hypothetical protein